MLVRIMNSAAGLAAAPVPVATGTAIKTMLQIKPGTTKPMKVTAWGISFRGSAAAVPINCELVEVNVAATVTAHVLTGFQRVDAQAIAAGDLTTNLILVGTTSTGFTATAEGTVTVARTFDWENVAPTNQYVYQFPLGREPVIQVSQFLRVRVTAPVDVDCSCWIEVEL